MQNGEEKEEDPLLTWLFLIVLDVRIPIGLPIHRLSHSFAFLFFYRRTLAQLLLPGMHPRDELSAINQFDVL